MSPIAVAVQNRKQKSQQKTPPPQKKPTNQRRVTNANSIMEPVAIIGMSFRFPGGAESPDDFWRMMIEKRCASAKVPPDRFNVDAFWHADSKKQNFVSKRRRQTMFNNAC